MALAGFGNFDIGEDLIPTLTTVTWPLDELARRGVEELVAAIDDEEKPSLEILTTELVVRHSA